MAFIDLIQNIFFQNSILFLICVGYTLIYSTTKTFQLISAVSFSLSAYSFYYLITEFNFPLPLSFFLSLIISITSCVFLDSLTLRKLRTKESKPLIGMILTLGIIIVFQNFSSIVLGDDLKLINTSGLTPYY